MRKILIWLTERHRIVTISPKPEFDDSKNWIQLNSPRRHTEVMSWKWLDEIYENSKNSITSQ